MYRFKDCIDCIFCFGGRQLHGKHVVLFALFVFCLEGVRCIFLTDKVLFPEFVPEVCLLSDT